MSNQQPQPVLAIGRNALATLLNTLSWLTAIAAIIFVIVSSLNENSHFIFYNGVALIILAIFLYLQASGLRKKS